MKKILAQLLFIFSILIISKINVNACPYAGGGIRWEKIGQDSFLISMEFLYDCNACPPPSYVRINADDGTSNQYINIVRIRRVDITPVCDSICSRCEISGCTFPFGYEIIEYSGLLVTSNFAGCWIELSYYGCCRNTVISTGAGSSSYFIESAFNKCLPGNNSAPKRRFNPTMIHGIGVLSQENFSFYDQDTNNFGNYSDLLTYELCSPKNHPNNTPISYNSPYSYQKPLSYPKFPKKNKDGFNLDTITGLLSFNPNKVQMTTMAYKVMEYRDGRLTGYVMNELFLYIITNLNSNNAPVLNVPDSLYVILGDTLSFNINLSDINTNDSVYFLYDSNFKNITTQVNSRTNQSINLQLTYVPEKYTLHNNPNMLMVGSYDNSCPLPGRSYKNIRIFVVPEPAGTYHKKYNSCGEYSFYIDPDYSNFDFTYNWYLDNKLISHKDSFNYKMNKSGQYSLKCEMLNLAGDTVFFFDNITTPNFLSVELPNINAGCYGDSIYFQANVYNEQGQYILIWNNQDTGNYFVQRNIMGSFFIEVEVQDLFCTNSDQLHLEVQQAFAVAGKNKSFCEYDTVFTTGQQYHYNGLPDKTEWFKVSNDSLISTNCKAGFTQVGDYIFKVTNQSGCVGIDTIFISKRLLPSVFAGDADTFCTSDETYELKGYPFDRENFWTGEGISEQNNKWFFDTIGTNLQTNEVFSLVYHYQGENECYGTDTLRLSVFDAGDFPSIGTDKAFCISDSIIFLDAAPSGGTWFGKGVVGDSFDFLFAGSGTHTLTYMVGTSVCPVSDSIQITVNPLPVARANTATGDYIFCPEADSIRLSGFPQGGLYGGKWSGDANLNGYFDPNRDEGDYQAIYTYKDNKGCIDSDTIFLKVEKVNIEILNKDLHVCKKETFTARAEFKGSNMMIWFIDSTADGSISKKYSKTAYYNHGPNDAKNKGFYLYAKNFNSVCPEKTDSVWVHIAAIPKADFAADVLKGNTPFSVSFYDSSKIEYDNIVKYDWDFGDGNTSILKNPTNTFAHQGNFDVSLNIESEYGCKDKIIKKSYIETKTIGIDENSPAYEVNIYPNPVNEKLYVHSNQTINQIKLINLTGEEIWAFKNLNKKDVEIERKGLASGVYFIQIQLENNETLQKKVIFN
jgi:hypothetical protein